MLLVSSNKGSDDTVQSAGVNLASSKYASETSREELIDRLLLEQHVRSAGQSGIEDQFGSTAHAQPFAQYDNIAGKSGVLQLGPIYLFVKLPC